MREHTTLISHKIRHIFLKQTKWLKFEYYKFPSNAENYDIHKIKNDINHIYPMITTYTINTVYIYVQIL